MLNNIQKSLLALGIGSGLAVVAATPSMAVPAGAYASGSATITLMNGASNSVGAELGAASGNSLGNTVTADPGALTATLATNTALIPSLGVTATAPTTVSGVLTFTAAAAAELNAYFTAGSLAEVVSIIRAGAGADGLD